MEYYKHVPILCDEALPDFMSILYKFGSFVHQCLVCINNCLSIYPVTAVEYYNYASIVCDEIMMSFLVLQHVISITIFPGIYPMTTLEYYKHVPIEIMPDFMRIECKHVMY